MRVIAGKKGHLKLSAPSGMNTRPTTDRIKETLFNILQNDVIDCSFLDLFSGSGQIGIEALSRGARKACFVESEKEAYTVIEKNLKSTGLLDVSALLKQNVFDALNKLSNTTFDIVFMDPPYDANLEKDVLLSLVKNNIVDENSLVIIEANKNFDLNSVENTGFTVTRAKIYKTNQHIFLKKKEEL